MDTKNVRTLHNNAFILNSNVSEDFKFFVIKLTSNGKYLEVLLKNVDNIVQISKDTTELILQMNSIDNTQILDTYKYHVKYLYSIPAKVDYFNHDSSTFIKSIYEVIE